MSDATPPPSDAVPARAPAPPLERAAYVLVALGLLFVFRFHLAGALIAGLLVYTLLHKTTHLLHGPRLSRGAARFLSVALLGLLAATLTAAIAVGLVAVVRGHFGELPALFQKLANILDETRKQLDSRGVSTGVLETLRDAAQLQEFAADWLAEHGGEIRRVGGELGRFLVHVLMGIVVGLLVFFRPAARPDRERPGPLYEALAGRVSRFAEAFESVVFAQVEISAINTFLTALYLLGALPLTGNALPFGGTLVLVTFLAGLIPVLGNLISNSVIVVLSLSVSPWVALGSLVFLVVIHKLEYFVNARIVGSKIDADAWEILLAILSFEVAFGVAGVVLAPVIYAYVKRELRDRGLL